MGAINGTAMVTTARVILGAIATDLISDAQGLVEVNTAYRSDVCTRFDLPELDKTATQTFTTGSAALSATDVLFIKVITTSTGIPLREVNVDEWNRLGYRVAVAGTTPTHWYRTGTGISGSPTIAVYPTPTSATLSINYQSEPAVMTTGATAIDAIYDELVTYYGASRIAAYLRMYDDSIKLRQYADALGASLREVKRPTPTRGTPPKPPTRSKLLPYEGGE